jgi:murein DD-endopeptidase MepM/ murein hydrolase activator NlpD
LIKIQELRQYAVKTQSVFAHSSVFFLIFAFNVNAEKADVSSLYRSIHTQILTHSIDKNADSAASRLAKIGKGDPYKIVSSSKDKSRVTVITTDSPKEFHGFSSDRSGLSGFSHFGKRFNRYTHKFNMMQLATAQGTVTSSLEDAANKAGLSQDLVTQLTQIFAWDIDFASNLHSGDKFVVVYERGGFNGADDIVAAEFTNKGRTFKAVRYIDKEGFANYYTPEGHALQKAFLTTPVDFARISSHFNLHRRHPVLNRIRAHKGVDYAARTGTPVKATGNGQISFLGRKGGYGQVIIIQHGDRYETVYAHLSGYKKGMKEGSAVRQGEVIGYVGQTGLATGPHLHYEFRIDGIHQNPLTAQATNSIPVKGSELAEFKSQIQDPLSKLNLIKANSLFAKTNNAYN